MNHMYTCPKTLPLMPVAIFVLVILDRKMQLQIKPCTKMRLVTWRGIARLQVMVGHTVFSKNTLYS